MAEQFVYTGVLNINGTINQNGVKVMNKPYDKIDKICVHKAIPINTVRPGMTYYFSNRALWIRGFDTATIPTDSIWSVHQTNTGSSAYIISQYEYTLVHIPLNFDVNKFWTDQKYIDTLCSECPGGKLKTVSPDYEIWDRRTTITIPVNINKQKDVGAYVNNGKAIFTGTPGRVYKAVNKNFTKDPVQRDRYVVDKDTQKSTAITTKKHYWRSKRRFFIFDNNGIAEIWSTSNAPWQYTCEFFDTETQATVTRTVNSTGRYQYVQTGTSEAEGVIQGYEYDKVPHINYRNNANTLRFHSANITPMKKNRKKLYPSVYSKKFCIGIKGKKTKNPTYQLYPLK